MLETNSSGPAAATIRAPAPGCPGRRCARAIGRSPGVVEVLPEKTVDAPIRRAKIIGQPSASVSFWRENIGRAKPARVLSGAVAEGGTTGHRQPQS